MSLTPDRGTPEITIVLLTHKRGAGIALLSDDQLLQTKVTDKTAENLASLFQSVLADSSLKIRDIHTLMVGVGPGSFTGLRLGCAFANGIKLGYPQINLLPLSTTNIFEENYEAQDIVTVEDLHTIIRAYPKFGSAREKHYVPSLHPQYGREPGPVIKLKEKRE